MHGVPSGLATIFFFIFFFLSFLHFFFFFTREFRLHKRENGIDYYTLASLDDRGPTYITIG